MDATQQLWQYEWLSSGRSPVTFRTMLSELQRFAAWVDKPLNTATVSDCLGYMTFRRESSGMSACEMAWRSLRSFYAFLAAEDGSANPMVRVKCPKRAEPAVKGITEAEYKALVATCKPGTPIDVRDRAILAVLWCTGLRRGEVANLTVNDVNTDARCLLVRKSKTGKPRTVPMSNDAHSALLRYMRVRDKMPNASHTVLWLGRKGVLRNDGLRLMLTRRSATAGVHVSAHQFRRSFAVEWLTKGGSQVSLMNICGWNTTAMPARYTRHAAGAVAEAEYRRLFG